MLTILQQETEESVSGLNLFLDHNILEVLGATHLKSKRELFDEYRVFIQSFGGGYRHIDCNTVLLYEVIIHYNSRYKVTFS